MNHYIIQCRLAFDDEDCLISVEANNDDGAFRAAENSLRAEDPGNDNDFLVQGFAKFATPPLEVVRNW